MGLKSILKSGFLDGLNPKKLIGAESLKMQTKSVGVIFKKALKPDRGEHYMPTSFEDCMRHYNLSEADLKKRMKNSLYTVYFCMGLSVITVASIFYQAIHHSVSGAILSVTLTLLLWVMSFREHFNLFQMRERRLGCSFKEWLCDLFKSKNK